MERARNMVNGFRKPFEKQNRHVPEFQIQLDDEHRQYGPGDSVSGRVILIVMRPIDITHLVVCLHGFAQAYRTPNTPGEGYREYNAALVSGKTNKAGGYYGNGFISLFEDELVLCGEGRLHAQQFRFGFELDFPKGKYPSSINFERGTITYMVTATLTRPNRPTIINQVLTAEVPVKYQESVDIGNVAVPRERMIKLLPQGRSMRKRGSRAQLKINLTEVETASIQNSETPDSPIESVHSTPSDNTPSVAGVSVAGVSIAGVSVGTRNSGKGKAPKLPFSNYLSSSRSQAIGCTVSLNKGGYLRGDLIEVKVQIEHNKVVKSLHGVIVTLYRVGRIDTNPSLQIISGEPGSKKRLLKGPSWLPSTTGCHLFRKDLNQTFASIWIDPSTLKQDIKATLRVPIDTFPTISSVPGAMISFRYYVEVIVDLPGKLSGLDKFLPSPGHNSAQGPYGLSDPGAHAGRDWASHCIDTGEFKREKDVHVAPFEVIVGTVDSSRDERTEILRPEPLNGENGENGSESGAASEGTNGAQRRQSDSMAPPDTEPIPTLPTVDESQLTEKDLLRLAEQRIIPSAPEIGESSNPSAPFESDIVPAYQNGTHHSGNVTALNIPDANVPAYEPRLPQNGDHATIQKEEGQRENGEIASAPHMDELDNHALPSAPPMDDFLEPPESYVEAGPSGSSSRRLHVEGVHDAEDVHDLPRYER